MAPNAVVWTAGTTGATRSREKAPYGLPNSICNVPEERKTGNLAVDVRGTSVNKSTVSVMLKEKDVLPPANVKAAETSHRTRKLKFDHFFINLIICITLYRNS